jgi:hypothetical protein
MLFVPGFSSLAYDATYRQGARAGAPRITFGSAEESYSRVIVFSERREGAGVQNYFGSWGERRLSVMSAISYPQGWTTLAKKA